LERGRLKPFQMVAMQAWRLSGQTTDGILMEMDNETRKVLPDDEPLWVNKAYKAQKRIACWCDLCNVPERRNMRGMRSPMERILIGGLDTVCRRAKLSPQKHQIVTMRVPSEIQDDSIVFAYDALRMRQGFVFRITVHTIGLYRNPPPPLPIVARVGRLCWQRSQALTPPQGGGMLWVQLARCQ
jgi:hypothetical protein